MAALAAAFAAARGAPTDVGLEETLLGAYQAGARAFPAVALSLEDYASHLAGLLPRDCDVAGELANLEAADLYLAIACARRDPKALQLFDEIHLARLQQLVGRMRLDAAALDELRQRLREHLLLSRDGRGPRIGDYAGKAPLSSWLRVAALRLALNLRRDEPRGEELAADAHAAVVLDPELAAIRRRFGADFSAALRGAFTSLQPRERNLLRLHFVERLGIDALAPLLQVSRATAARHLAAARDALVERTTRDLRSRLKLAPAELDSLVAQVRSKLEVSLGALLRD